MFDRVQSVQCLTVFGNGATTEQRDEEKVECLTVFSCQPASGWTVDLPQ